MKPRGNTFYRNTVSDALWNALLMLSACDELHNFRLVGGTALALYFGHRVSVDMDWFSDTSFDSREVSELLVHSFGLQQAVITENSVSGEISGIKIDVIAHRYPWIEEAVKVGGIRLASVGDIAAMKLNAIANRGSKKDFWDIATLLNQYSLDELLAVFGKRYPHVNVWQVVRSLTYFEDAESEPDPIVLDHQDWMHVKGAISTAAHNYF